MGVHGGRGKGRSGGPSEEVGVSVSGGTRTVEVGGLDFDYDERVLTPRPWTEAQSLRSPDSSSQWTSAPSARASCSMAGYWCSSQCSTASGSCS